MLDNSNNTIILCEEFAPNGKSFYLWQNKTIEWNNYELYVSIDLSSCIKSTENIISIGSDIGVYTGANKWHIYYTPTTRQIGMHSISNTSLIFRHILEDSANVTIIINKDGIYINNQLVTDMCNNIASFNEYCSNNAINIGSLEGNNRSNATYKLVCLKSYKKRRDVLCSF